jgi:hypothetical protein
MSNLSFLPMERPIATDTNKAHKISKRRANLDDKKT